MTPSISGMDQAMDEFSHTLHSARVPWFGARNRVGGVGGRAWTLQGYVGSSAQGGMPPLHRSTISWLAGLGHSQHSRRRGGKPGFVPGSRSPAGLNFILSDSCPLRSSQALFQSMTKRLSTCLTIKITSVKGLRTHWTYPIALVLR